MSNWEFTHEIVLSHPSFLGRSGQEDRVVPVCWGRQSGFYQASDAYMKPAFRYVDGKVAVENYPVSLPTGTEVSARRAPAVRRSRRDTVWSSVAEARSEGKPFSHLIPENSTREKLPHKEFRARWLAPEGAERMHRTGAAKVDAKGVVTWESVASGELTVLVEVFRDGVWRAVV